MVVIALAWLLLALRIEWHHLADWKRWYLIVALVVIGVFYVVTDWREQRAESHLSENDLDWLSQQTNTKPR